MPIYYRKDRKLYYADYVDAFGHRRRLSLDTPNKRVAEMKFAEMLRRENLIKQTGVPNMSWEQFKQKFFAFINLERAPSTVARYKLAIRYLEELHSFTYLHEITPNVLQHLKETLLSRHKGIAGVNRDVKAIKAMMHLAEKWELVPAKKWQNVTKIKEKKGRVEFYTEEEINRMLALWPSWRVVILLGVRAGLRRAEMAMLRWDDIDFENNQIYVGVRKEDLKKMSYHDLHKSYKFRYVPLSPQLKEALLDAKKRAKTPFVVNIKGKALRTDRCYISSAFNIKLKRRHFKGTLHTLRHTFASHLVQRDVTLYKVKELMGHESIKTTEIYAHLAPKTLQDAIKKLL